ncbi:MAG: phosphatase [Pseudarcicella sp.]|nr:phosphatase [Pseudarcicella sp.]
MKSKIVLLSALSLAFATSCKKDDEKTTTIIKNDVVLKEHSVTPNFLKLESDFSNASVYTLFTSEDQFKDSPNYVFGALADGTGLLKNADGTYTMLVNTEANYAITRITLDATFKPIKGEYILNSDATANTAMCSATMVTPQEHGFGPLYLSGGEWGGASKNVFSVNPYKSASEASVGKVLANFGQWSVENAIVLNKNAYPGKTVAVIGDDDSDIAGGQVAMYLSNTTGDVENGKLYGMKVANAVVEKDIKEGASYAVSFVELTERTYDALNAECISKGVIGLNRVEDLDYRKGSAANNREIYFNSTGRKGTNNDIRSKYGRVYKLVLDEKNPLVGTLKVVLDADNLTGDAKEFHSPDNITVTENYAYIQEDQNGITDDIIKQHKTTLYQYNLKTGAVKKVLQVDNQLMASKTDRFGIKYDASTNPNGSNEITGMIDISNEIGIPDTFLMAMQCHSWTNDAAFANPDGGSDDKKYNKGSAVYVIKGLPR